MPGPHAQHLRASCVVALGRGCGRHVTCLLTSSSSSFSTRGSEELSRWPKARLTVPSLWEGSPPFPRPLPPHLPPGAHLRGGQRGHWCQRRRALGSALEALIQGAQGAPAVCQAGPSSGECVFPGAWKSGGSTAGGLDWLRGPGARLKGQAMASLSALVGVIRCLATWTAAAS